MLLKTVIPHGIPRVFRIPQFAVHGLIPQKFPGTPGEFLYMRNAEFVERYEAMEEKGRCFVERVLYLFGVKNIVTKIEKEVVLATV